MTDNQTRRIMADLERVTNRVLQKLTLDIKANLEEDTPVDTGWARSNWVPSIGTPFSGLIGSRESVDGAGSGTAAATVATTYTLDKGSIFISNNVPYIGHLNEGSSIQAPRAFVQAGIDRAIRDLRIA